MKSLDLYQFMELLAGRGIKANIDFHFQPQHKRFDIEKLDFIGRFESLHEDWAKLNLPPLECHLNKSEHKPWLEYCYDRGVIRKQVRMLEELYATDYQLFGYERLKRKSPTEIGLL